MSNYNPSFRSDRRQLARSTGGSAAGFFWGILAAVNVLFWPSIYNCGTLAKETWYGLLGAIVMILLVSWASSRTARPMHVPPPAPKPKMPDLRESDVFEGER